MHFDVAFVTYQSSAWLDGLFESLQNADYDKKQLHLYFCDNASKDDTVEKLEAYQKTMGERFGDFVVWKSQTNMGFGKGNNLCASLGSSPYLLMLNIDTSLYPDTLNELVSAIQADERSTAAMWELRQFPYEHPKIYDVLTSETSWASGACFAIKRSVYEQIGGFDESFFMYAEDVDLSWRVRLAGYCIRYVPKAVINHYCYQTAGEIKPLQYLYSLIGNVHMRCKYGTSLQVRQGLRLSLAHVYRNQPPFPGARKQWLKALWENRKILRQSRAWYRAHRQRIGQCAFQFLQFDYEHTRKGAFWACSQPGTYPKVSVIVRTCGRPDILRETLISLRRQTYPNIEIVIVEDGPDVSAEMLRQEFADLPIVYKATGNKVGRCVAGNEAMSMASGEYFNFLDDDDVFFADHVETLVSALQRNPGYRAAYALAFETPVAVESTTPYRYSISEYRSTLDEPFSRPELLYHNLFPIQSVLFSRALYERYGGFSTELDVLEDWDLWIRYALDNPFLYVPKTTSQYRTPADLSIRESRAAALDNAYACLKEKNAHRTISMTGAELEEEIKNAPFLQRQCFNKASITQSETLPLALARKIYHSIFH